MILRPFTFPFRYAFAVIKKKIGKLDTIKIETLYAFGNEDKVFFKARVVESYKQSKPSVKKSYFQNILAAIRRYAGSSIPNAKVEVSYHGEKIILESDADGIIDGSFSIGRNEKTGKDNISFQLVPEDELKPETDSIQINVLRYHSDYPMGIISDIDDTILISHATQTGKKFWLSVSKNAYTRRPFPGVSNFYKELGAGGKNPLFYVSSSDWNLFDMIRDFMDFRNIPVGPLLLKDLHVDLKNILKSGGGSHQHKIEKIKMLLNLYPGMRFILIGDSGQHDPEIYAEIIADHPGRVIAVYIREIKPITQQRRKLLKAKIEDPKAPDVTFVKDTHEMISYAKTHKIIS